MVCGGAAINDGPTTINPLKSRCQKQPWTKITAQEEHSPQRAQRSTECRLFDLVVFLDVVGTTKKLDIVGGVGSAAFGERDDVVEVKVDGGSAFHAFPTVAFPDFLFHNGWDDPAMGRLSRDGNLEVFFALNGDELEFEDLSAVRCFTP